MAFFWQYGGVGAVDFFQTSCMLHQVLKKCAQLLGFDSAVPVGHMGTLVRGSTIIKSLSELQPGQVHNLTLVLS